MKKLKIFLAMILLVSCTRRGEITNEPRDFIEINGKVYKIVKIVPESGEESIWIIYPKDSADKMPTTIGYNYIQGKISHKGTIVKIE